VVTGSMYTRLKHVRPEAVNDRKLAAVSNVLGILANVDVAMSLADPVTVTLC